MRSRVQGLAGHAWFPWLLVALVAGLAQMGAWRAAFYMDDYPHILMRDAVTGVAALDWGWKGRVLTFGLWRMVYGFFGPDPVAFHALNWSLHVLVALLSFAVLRRFAALGPSGVASRPQVVGCWGALLFAAHPLAVEPVHYAAQTSMLLATGLVMLAALFYLRWVTGSPRRIADGLGCVAAVLLAGMAKEPGIWHALIGLFFLTCAARAQNDSRPFGRVGWRTRWGILIGVGLMGSLFAHAWLKVVLEHWADPVVMGHHGLTQARVLGEYIRLLILPIALSSDHQIAWTVSWSEGEAVFRLIDPCRF